MLWIHLVFPARLWVPRGAPYYFCVLRPFPPAAPHGNSNPDLTEPCRQQAQCLAHGGNWIKRCNKTLYKRMWIRLLLLGKRKLQIYCSTRKTGKQDYLKQWLSIHWTSINGRKRLGTNEVSPVIAPASCLEKVSSHRTKGKSRRVQWTELRTQSRGSWMPRQLRDCREEYWRGERCTDRTLEICRSLTGIFSGELISASIWGGLRSARGPWKG